MTEEVPEGCTPTDARILREANHKLAQENFELREFIQSLEWSETGYDEGGNGQNYCPACGGCKDLPFRGTQGHRADCKLKALLLKWDSEVLEWPKMTKGGGLTHEERKAKRVADKMEESKPAPNPPSTHSNFPRKDHNTAELINALRDRAVKYHGAEQLRAQLANLIHPVCDRLKAAEGVTRQKPAMWQARVKWATTHPDHAWVEVTPTKQEPTVEERVKYLGSLVRYDGTPAYEFRALFSFDQIEGKK